MDYYLMTRYGLSITESNLQDGTFEFERKRNRPEWWDRNLTQNTLKAIKTIDKVRSRREETHLNNRNKVRLGEFLKYKEARFKTLANTWFSPLPHAQNIDANKSMRRCHIVNRARISVAEHGQPDSACDEGWHLSFVASTKLISLAVLMLEKLVKKLCSPGWWRKQEGLLGKDRLKWVGLGSEMGCEVGAFEGCSGGGGHKWVCLEAEMRLKWVCLGAAVGAKTAQFRDSKQLLTGGFTAEIGPFGHFCVLFLQLLYVVFTASNGTFNLYMFACAITVVFFRVFGTQDQGKVVGGDPFFIQDAADSLNVVFKMMEFEQDYNTKE
ncbi:hypothetical protein Tco_0977028 [Tanacetum coccineum]|uniref:Uncharacterized protein n=1 Tax=Tanacetum coccineum TaxID=301880 RepID=A0ABQ5EIW3_9ASTR